MQELFDADGFKMLFFSNKVSPVNKKPNKAMSGNHLNVIKPLFAFGLILGVTPFSNPKSSSNNWSFRWFCLQTLYCIAVLVINVWYTVVVFLHFASAVTSCKYGINDAVVNLNHPLLCLSCVFTNMQCFRATKLLTPLLGKWNGAIQLTKTVTGEKFQVNIKTIHVLVTITVLCLSATVEIIFSETCKIKSPTIAYFILHAYTKLVNTYHDILLIIVALVVRSNYKAIADYVKYRGLSCRYPENVRKWRLLRECHLELNKLTMELDTVLTHMVMQSYAFNVFFLCTNVSTFLRTSVQIKHHIAHLLFLIFHLSFKTFTVSYALSEVPQQVRAPMENLLDCQSVTYGVEVYRFTFLLTYVQIGFTASRFFLIDKRIFMAVLSLIITYDLVLLKLS
ncbi:Gr1p [Chamberlinius hualienensis]